MPIALRQFAYQVTAPLRRLTNNLMSRCRVCGSTRDVICYDPRGLWAYFQRKTYCPEHCPDHDFVYDRGMREWCCNVCSEHPPRDFWAYDPD